MISRLLGFVRDILTSSLLGASAVADAFNQAFAFPNLFRRIFAEGALNAAFLPIFSKKLEQDGRLRARLFAEEIMIVLLVILLILLAIAEMAMPFITHFLVSGYASVPGKIELTVLLTRITFPYLLFISIVALFSGVLNALGRFALAAAAPIVLNVVLISVLVAVLFYSPLDQENIAFCLSWGVFVAGVIQLLMIVYGLQRENMSLSFRMPSFNADMKKFFWLVIPGVIVGAATQINIVVGRSIASVQDGAASWLYYADRVYQLPLGIVGIAIGVVLLPNLSKSLKTGNMRAVSNSQNRSIEFAMFLTLPASVALFVASEEILRVIFERGAMKVSDTQAMATALEAYAWGLPSFVLIKVFSPVFFARESMWRPMFITIFGMIANVVLALYLRQYFGYVGVAIATTISGWVTASLLWYMLHRLGFYRPDEQLAKTLGPIVLSSVMMGCLIWAGLLVFGSNFAPSKSLIIQILSLGVLVVGGLLVYAMLAHFTGALHLPTFLRTVTGRNRA